MRSNSTDTIYWKHTGHNLFMFVSSIRERALVCILAVLPWLIRYLGDSHAVLCAQISDLDILSHRFCIQAPICCGDEYNFNQQLSRYTLQISTPFYE